MERVIALKFVAREPKTYPIWGMQKNQSGFVLDSFDRQAGTVVVRIAMEAVQA